ncbi:protein of unknown function [Catalinimonas alkaloidigena]|uniref:DUF349 domain-containing protein n=1 Tax=Catalinimonas alkaloidigena TaxID=1075417 RepID=A0A1G9D9D6_9BACT|nr:DUF349 domain-containing protein [Catalinimonas alkaloidigena]SDK60487.1 protein of unknown function [Catalinimonas alkaloidigena]
MQDASEYGFVRDGNVYLKASERFPERVVGEVKESEEASIEYFVQRYEQLHQKLEALFADIERAQNKGSYLMKLLHLREQLASYDAIGDFEALANQLEAKEQEIRAGIEQNRIKNLEIKRALLQEAELLKESTDWKETAEKMKELKTRWLKTGAVQKEHHDTLEGQFETSLNYFFERRKAFFEDRRQLTEERIGRYEELIQKAEALRNNGAPTSQLQNSLRALHDEWKSVGGIPKAKSAELWSSFKKISDDIFRKTKRDKGGNKRMARDKFLQTNLDIKRQLCKEATELSALELPQAIERAKTLQAHWKNTGPIPAEYRQELNETFATACDRVFEESYLLRVTQARNPNFRAKSATEQVSLKISVLYDLIRKDESELLTFEENFQNINVTDQSQPMNKLLQAKLRSNQRKLRIKQTLLQELKEEKQKLKD